MSVLGVDALVGIPFARCRCLALVLAGLERIGLAWPDPWEKYQEAWASGRPIAECVPPGWQEIPVDTPLRRGDVIVTPGAGAEHVALALGAGFALSTSETTGSYLARARAFRGRVRVLLRKGGLA